MNNELSNSFENIKDYKTDIENILGYINNKVEELNSIYNNYLTEINDTLTYRISLDTFNFQTKLIDIENSNHNKLFKLFFNRIYGDYYKLYKKLIEYVKTNVQSVKIINNNNYPKYKDLDQLTEYSFDFTQNLFSEILSILNELNNFVIKENHNIKEIQKKQNNGININNFLNERKYSSVILEQKINLYYEIIKGYISFQLKYLKRFYLKLKLNYTQLCQDINLETSVSQINDINKKEYKTRISKDLDIETDLIKKIDSFVIDSPSGPSDSNVPSGPRDSSDSNVHSGPYKLKYIFNKTLESIKKNKENQIKQKEIIDKKIIKEEKHNKNKTENETSDCQDCQDCKDFSDFSDDSNDSTKFWRFF